jgi:hypothetical protein
MRAALDMIGTDVRILWQATANGGVAIVNEIDLVVLQAVCRRVLDTGAPEIWTSALEVEDIGPAALQTSLHVLKSFGYIAGEEMGEGDDFLMCSVTHKAMDDYLRTTMPNYTEVAGTITRYIAKQRRADTEVLAEELHLPLAVVNHVVEVWRKAGDVEAFETGDTSRGCQIIGISARLERLAGG